MYRRAYTLLVGVAAVMGGLALVVSIRYDQPLLDPEGKFLGPSWARLPILLLLAIGIDLLPKAIWNSRGRPGSLMPAIRERLRTHWTRDRVTLVVLGVVCFYVTYVSYRNLKSALPFVIDTKYDRELHLLDKALFFGNDPSTVMHTVLGTGVSAHVLSYIYLWFLPLVPLALMAWLVWSPNLSYGYWFATSQCIAWSLGTLSYYALPTLGPGLEYRPLYTDLAHTPTDDLMKSLVEARHQILTGGYDGSGVEGIVNSVAGLRQPALRDHPAGRADGAVHAAVAGPEDRLLDQLRPHHGGHGLLRLALPRRRHRRRDDRVHLLLPRRHRQRAEVREAQPALAPDDHDGPGARRRRLSARPAASRAVGW